MAWSKLYGPWGCRVTVRELPDGWMQADIRVQGYPRKRVRLGHRDREAAKRWAKATQADLQRGITRILDSQPALDRMFGLYLRYQTPKKRSPSSRQNDERSADLWQRVLGADKTPDGITTREWEEFVVGRRSGAIDPRGHFVAPRELAEKEPPRKSGGAKPHRAPALKVAADYVNVHPSAVET
ncbi:hypothetical protein LCGC14_1364350 [marine sediment metagenome]|uniref:Uncharacterized protein n=1 Tax=marine sediment metagenome TaxID=412755 RepID=A0A0F9N9B2_9ZZZZ